MTAQETHHTMNTDTITDTNGNEFTPATMYVHGSKEKGGHVPWAIVQHYGPDVTMDEIIADLRAESEEA